MVRRRLRPRHPASQRHRSAGRRKRRQTKPNQNQRKVCCRLDLNHRRTARRVVNEADPRRVVRFPHNAGNDSFDPIAPADEPGSRNVGRVADGIRTRDIQIHNLVP